MKMKEERKDPHTFPMLMTTRENIGTVLVKGQLALAQSHTPGPRYRYDLPVHLSLDEPSELHLDRFRHLHHTLPKHFKFGSIFVLSRTTSSIFRYLPTMAYVFG
jgi:hypothetical protein